MEIGVTFVERGMLGHSSGVTVLAFCTRSAGFVSGKVGGQKGPS